MASLLTLDMLPSTIALRPAVGDTIAGAPSDAWLLLGDGSTDILINAPLKPIEYAISSGSIAKMLLLDAAANTLAIAALGEPNAFFMDGPAATLFLNVQTTLSDQISGIAPIDPSNLTRKDYVDDLINGVAGDFILKTGDTMTGQLGGITPLAAADMTRKDYVDAEVLVAFNAATAANDNANTRQLESEKGANDGYCPLDSVGLVPAINLPITNITFKGGFDASPGLLPTPAVGGDLYIITVSGTLSVIPADGSSPGTPVPTVVNIDDQILFSSADGFWYQIIPSFAQFDLRYVRLAGSIMTGQLEGITPVSAPDMTRKDYVDAGDLSAENNANSRILRAGDTMSGQLSGITPTAAANLTRKDYVDLNKLENDFLRTGTRLDITNVRTS